MGEITLKLSKTYKWMDKEVSEVTFRKPKMKHLKGMDLTAMKADEVILMAGRISDLPTLFFEELDWEDGMKVMEVIADFLQPSQKTGPK